MDEQSAVMILGGSPNIVSSLKSDLEVLGFRPSTGRYPDVDVEAIKKPLGAVLLELTVYDHDAISVYELLSREEILPPKTALVGLVSETVMGQIPVDYKFTDIIRFPYKIAELGLRMHRAIYLYHHEFAKDTIRVGNLSISPSRYEVKVNGQPIVLSHKEYELLKYLITHPNNVFTREKLLASIWGDNVIDGSRTVDVHIRRVRAKIGDIDQTYIKTVHGVGYAFRFRDEDYLRHPVINDTALGKQVI